MEALRHSTHLYGRRLVLEWAAEEEETVDALREGRGFQIEESFDFYMNIVFVGLCEK